MGTPFTHALLTRVEWIFFIITTIANKMLSRPIYTEHHDPWEETRRCPTNILPPVSISEPGISYCGCDVLWISFVSVFKWPLYLHSAPTRPTLLLYPGLRLASECIELCTPKAVLISKYITYSFFNQSNSNFYEIPQITKLRNESSDISTPP